MRTKVGEQHMIVQAMHKFMTRGSAALANLPLSVLRRKEAKLLECDVVWHDVLSARPDLVV